MRLAPLPLPPHPPRAAWRRLWPPPSSTPSTRPRWRWWCPWCSAACATGAPACLPNTLCGWESGGALRGAPWRGPAPLGQRRVHFAAGFLPVAPCPGDVPRRTKPWGCLLATCGNRLRHDKTRRQHTAAGRFPPRPSPSPPVRLAPCRSPSSSLPNRKEPNMRCSRPLPASYWGDGSLAPILARTRRPQQSMSVPQQGAGHSTATAARGLKLGALRVIVPCMAGSVARVPPLHLVATRPPRRGRAHCAGLLQLASLAPLLADWTGAPAGPWARMSGPLCASSRTRALTDKLGKGTFTHFTGPTLPPTAPVTLAILCHAQDSKGYRSVRVFACVCVCLCVCVGWWRARLKIERSLV